MNPSVIQVPIPTPIDKHRIIDLTDSIPDITVNLIHDSQHHQLPSELFENVVFEALNNLIDDFASDPDKYLKPHHQTLLDRSYTDTITQLKDTLTYLEVAQIKRAAIAQGIWDFYPTPQNVIDKMLELAQLHPHHCVLEPSASSGDLIGAIARAGVNKIDCFELHPLLQKALKLQGFSVLGDNFLKSQPKPIYDHVLANPPFANNGVNRHTRQAFKWIKPGGRLITLAHHYQLKLSYSDRQFFSWLQRNNARFLNCGQAFAHSDHKTDVPLQIIVIDKL